ncbi:MAG: putative E3 ubiquitin-protein ligase RNF185 [Streblomastix strix]|uniref:RING-type E3 ubiquitin transferase n=1 Tax=Streblomastix strix TaxID=222440 RepID=A0A5J4X4Y7_9EUKA|nr:MAG: putative E3 ubiquitin-protein ligase RNF185 [Streblomastix strix]
MESELDNSCIESVQPLFDTEEQKAAFSCCICLDLPTDPVLTACGHLFCWPCLHEWMQTRSACPVCNAACNRDYVTPIYGRGKEQIDPRTRNIPTRPAARIPQVSPDQLNQHNQQAARFQWDDQGQLSILGVAYPQFRVGAPALDENSPLYPILQQTSVSTRAYTPSSSTMSSQESLPSTKFQTVRDVTVYILILVIVIFIVIH